MADFEHVAANKTKINADGRTQQLGLLKEFEDFLMEI